MLDNVNAVAGYFTQQLEGLKSRFPDVVLDVRGRGLLIGVKLATNNRAFMQLARDQHLLVAGGGDNCVRLLPPLVMTQDEAREAIAKFEATCEAARATLKPEAGPGLRRLSILRSSLHAGTPQRYRPVRWVPCLSGKRASVSMTQPIRHFLDLWRLDAATIRALLEEAKRRKAARAGWLRGRADADAPAGRDAPWR